MDGKSLAHHSEAPVTEVVYEQPCLFRKSHRRLFLQTKTLCHWAENPVDAEGPNRSKSEDGTGHEVTIFPALIIQPFLGFVVGYLEEWCCE
jgi:hypothetical protein